MRFLDTERLLPNPDNPYVKGTGGVTFKTEYNEADYDADTELGFAYNGVTPFYMASALYATNRITSGNRQNIIQPQIAPFINGGIKAGSFTSITTAVDKEKFYGTYYHGWRVNEKNLGVIVTNPVGGHSFNREPFIERAGKRRKQKNQRAARFKGAWAAERGGRKLYCTLCGYYAGLENVHGYREWKIEQGQAVDGGLGFARSAGFRTKWVRAPLVPYQLAKHIWQKASRMFRAYTGYVAQTLGSSSYFSTVYMYANGCWEQLRESDPYVMGLDFSEHLNNRLCLEGRGASKFHMLDLLDLNTNSHRLTNEVSGWNGSHIKFLGSLYKIEVLEITSFNGDTNKGPVLRKIPYVNLLNGEQVALLAKCRTLVGGIRSVLTKVKDGWERDKPKDKIVERNSGAIFNASCVTTDVPDAGEVVFENLFVIEPPVLKDTTVGTIDPKGYYDSGKSNIPFLRRNAVTDDQLFDSRIAAPPVPRSSYHERVKRTPSVETFPNADIKDNGLMPQVVAVKVANSSDAMKLTIVLADGSERKVGFMPTSVLLVDDRDKVLASHNKVAAGNYGYGFLEEDPYSGKDGIEIFNTAPEVNRYGGQERWHVPYKDLIKRSWEKAVGKLSSTSFGEHGTAKENPYIFKRVSDSNPANRYTMYDLQIRPPTFLPLFMTAEVCHEGGATSFARALALGLVESLQLNIDGTTVIFTQPAPSWATDAKAYRESIVTLLLLGGFVVESVMDENGVTRTTDFSNDTPFRGSPSDSFWRLLAEASGLDSVSDLITHYGVTDGVANIPSSVIIAAAVKDPVSFGSSMGVTVVRVGDGYMIGTRYYADLAEVVAALTDIATYVISVDRTNVENVTTALGIPESDEVAPEPKRYAKPFNWLLLLPHATTAAAVIATKATQRQHLSK